MINTTTTQTQQTPASQLWGAFSIQFSIANWLALIIRSCLITAAAAADSADTRWLIHRK
jgi:hypothetical protein